MIIISYRNFFIMKYNPIIDTEGIIYAIACVLNKQYQEANFDEIKLDRLDKQAVNMIQNKFRAIFKYCEADMFIGFIHGKGNFRTYVDPQYKANRKNTERPVALNRITELAKNRYKLYIVDNIEVDDACAICLNYYNNIKDINPILVSPDKDLLQVPGHHLRVKMDGELLYSCISEEEGLYNLLIQVIKGDPNDNVKSIEGAGEVAAKKILSYPSTDNGISNVMKAYIERYGNLKGSYLFSRNFQLLYMIRESDYGFEIPKFIKLG